MAKSQKRSNREVRKPKGTKVKPPPASLADAVSPVNALMRKPKGKV